MLRAFGSADLCLHPPPPPPVGQISTMLDVPFDEKRDSQEAGPREGTCPALPCPARSPPNPSTSSL